MSDLSVSEASEVTLLQELLTRKTENGHHLFKESSITNKEGKVQLLGIMANVEMTLTPKPKEEGEKEEE
jgi:hypothetical protein|tara:strand:+ start:75 stop:281 length:207 start_codon:yes stop_codon:yes gene_type:complete